MKTNSETRRINLQRAILIAGSAEMLAELACVSAAYISQIKNSLPDSKTGVPKNAGDDFARKIEIGIKMPKGWMDHVHEEVLVSPGFAPNSTDSITDNEFVEIEMLENELGAGGGVILHDYDLVKGRLAYRRDWLTKRGLRPECLRILPIKGNSMIPYLFDGNKAVIDTADKRIVDGDHYAIRVGDEAKVKRLFKQPDGKIRVESYNASTEYIGPGDDAEVLGHVVDRKGA